MNWERMPALEEAVHSGCLNCPSKPVLAEMDRMIAVGFGDAHARKGDEIVYNEPREGEAMTFSDIEALAEKDPDHDWRVVMNAPLWEGEWQRHGPKTWVLVRKGMGFA